MRILGVWSRTHSIGLAGAVGATLATLLATLSAGPVHALAEPPGASADDGSPVVQGAGRLHVFNFNICDQYQVDEDSVCHDDTPERRASYIASAMNLFPSDAATFQEMCANTFNRLWNYLGRSTWDARFYSTTNRNFDTCQSTDTRWGLAIFTRTTFSGSGTAYPLPDDAAEQRVVFCANTTIYSGFRLCSTHLTPAPSDDQLDAVGNLMYTWGQARNATIIGGDFNVNQYGAWPSCSHANRMTRMYNTERFGYGTRSCGPGGNWYHEADNQNAGGDGTYDEYTVIPPNKWKLDYVFFNKNRFYSDPSNLYGGDLVITSLSDHRYYKAAMTIHD